MPPRRRPKKSKSTDSHETQTVTTHTGQRIPTAYQNMRGVRTQAFNPPEAGRLRMLIAGPVGIGKTSLICSVPNCAVLDIERKTSGVMRTAPGTMIFGNVENGEPPWGLKEFSQLIEQLIQDAKDGNMYFQTVAIDTVGGLCELVKTEFTAQWNKAPKSDDPNWKPWEDFASFGADGAGYGKMNSWITSRLERLVQCGYGIIYSTHKELKYTSDSDGNDVAHVRLSGNPGVITHIVRTCEYAGEIEREIRRIKTSGKPRKVRDRLVPGKPEFHDEETVVLRLHNLTNSAQSAIRQHVPMPPEDIVLPEGHGWDAFVEAYNEAVESRRSEIES